MTIPKIMQILSKQYPSSNKTTLNRMRTKQINVVSSEATKDATLQSLEESSQENQGVFLHSFKVLISCLLSLRTQDKNTKRASDRLFAVAQTPQEILKLKDQELEKLIFSSGHYRKKAKTLKHVSSELINRFNSKVPSNKEELLSIKGIGPKTANIVLAFAFGQSVLPIDTHCNRIPNRLGWVKTKTPTQTEKELEKILPKKYWNEFNAIFVQFGKTICQPISPWCSKCKIREYCKRIGVERSR
ncbi:endonuclease III domain-containing protein [Nanoarchaeota archaeon]